MKKFVLLAGVITLSACNGEAEAPAEEAAPVVTYAGGEGTYTRTNAEGEEVSTAIAADGTYTSSVNGEEVGTGSVTVDGAKICFEGSNTGDEGPACWTNQPMREDGSFETTNPDGETYVIQMTPPVAE